MNFSGEKRTRTWAQIEIEPKMKTEKEKKKKVQHSVRQHSTLEALS